MILEAQKRMLKVWIREEKKALEKILKKTNVYGELQIKHDVERVKKKTFEFAEDESKDSTKAARKLSNTEVRSESARLGDARCSTVTFQSEMTDYAHGAGQSRSVLSRSLPGVG